MMFMPGANNILAFSHITFLLLFSKNFSLEKKRLTLNKTNPLSDATP